MKLETGASLSLSKYAILIGMVATTFMLASCGRATSGAAVQVPQSPGSIAAGGTTPGEATRTSRVDRPRTYDSIKQLREASAIVVVADATSVSEVQQVEGVPFTVRTFKIVQRAKGQAPDAIKVRELGRESDLGTTRGTGRYVLFLRPFEFTPGVQHEGQYTPLAGAAGIYLVNGDTASSITDDRDGLPASFSVKDLS